MEKKASTSSSSERGDEGEDADIEILLDRGKPKSAEQIRKEELELVRHLNDMESKIFSGHLIDVITDEVALEGLDGITIQALKVRLEARPNFAIDGFEDIAPAIWNQMKFCNYFRFYVLPNPRPDLVPYCWDQNRDERGNAYEPLHAPEEIYLYNPIDAKKEGIRGSCMQYETRRDITHLAKACSYSDMIPLFGNRLVIVANQHIREKTLFGLNYKKHRKLTVVQYCIMERVGRSRFNGEITRGKISSACMSIPPKTLFYMRKHLVRSGLILRQSVSIKFANCRCPAGVTVFHLPRFYKRIESISSLNTRTVFSWLNNSPTKSVPVDTIISKYGKHTMRALTSQFSTLLGTTWEVQPLPAGYSEKKKNRKPKTVRVLKLKHSDMSLQNQVLGKVLDRHAVGEETDGVETPDAPEEKEEVINIDTASTYSDIRVLRPGHQYLIATENYRLYLALLRSGIGGLTLLDISSYMSLTPLEGRSAGRFLSRHNACREGVVKIFKQKAFTYILCVFSKEDLEIHLFMQEKFMFATLEMNRIREFIIEKERKRLEAVMKKAKRARSLKVKASRSSSISTVSDEDEKEADEPMIAQPSSSKKTSQASKATSRSVLPALPELLSKDDAPQDVKPSKDDILSGLVDDFSSPPSLKPVETKIFNSNDDESYKEEDVEPLPRSSYLVAVINTRELMEPQAVIRMSGESTPDYVDENSDHEMSKEEKPSPEKSMEDMSAVDGCLNVESILPTDAESVEEVTEDSESVSDGPRLSRRGDAIDEQIRRKMSRQRVDWKDTEDRFILLAFIASSLFISKYNYGKVFLFNSPQIRDLMLKKSGGKSNKTSAAIRRRVHFLLHQKPRFEEYIGLVGAALRDNVLYENLVKDHMRPPQQRIYCNPPINALEAVIEYMYNKVADPERKISNSRSSLKGIDTLLFLRQLKRTEFYWNATMFAIFCPMGDTSYCRGAFNRRWRSIQRQSAKNRAAKDTQYNEISSSSSVIKKKFEDRDLDEPKTPQDFYLEYCSKFLRFITKHCNIMFQNMLILASLNLKGFQIVSYDMSTANSNICVCVRECTSETEVRLWTARSLVLDFIFSGESSKLADRFVTEKCNYPLVRATRSLTRARVLLHNKRTGLLCVSRTNLRNFVGGLPAYAYDEMLDFLKYLDEASKIDSLACISAGILHGIVELTDYFQSSFALSDPIDIFTLNEDWAPLYNGMTDLEEKEYTNKKETSKPNTKRRGRGGKTRSQSGSRSRKKTKLTAMEEESIDNMIDDECFGDLEEGGNTPSSPPKQTGAKVGLEEGECYISSSNSYALRLLRIRLNEAGVNSDNFTGYVEKDFFTLNLPNLELVFPSRTSLNHKIAGSSHPFSMDELKDLRKGLVELVYHHVSGGNFDVPNMEKYLGRYTVLFDVISSTGVVGVSGSYLETMYERKSLVKGLKYLLEAKLIFSVGVAHRRFVSFNNVYDWIIPIRPVVGNSSVGHVIMRPWITPTGGLSWLTVSRLFNSLLGQMQKPEFVFDELCQVFSPTLSPVEAAVLIEALAKLNYLVIYRIKKQIPSLWSKPGPPTVDDIEYNAEILVDTKDVYVAISPYITFLHAQLNQAIQRAYKKQF